MRSNERIPAHSEVVIWAVTEGALQDGSSWLVEPTSQTGWVENSHPPSVVSVFEGGVPVCVGNWSSEDHFLPCGMEIGKVTPVVTIAEVDATQLGEEPYNTLGGRDDDARARGRDLPADQDPWSVLHVGDRRGLLECSSAHESDSELTHAPTHDEVATHGLATRGASDSGQVSEDNLTELREMVRRHRKVFAMSSKELGRTSVMEHKIDTGGAHPIFQPARRLAWSARATARDLVDDMMSKGVVEDSSSPWSAPIVLVTKKDGSTRFCVDYRKLNAITVKDPYPLPQDR